MAIKKDPSTGKWMIDTSVSIGGKRHHICRRGYESKKEAMEDLSFQISGLVEKAKRKEAAAGKNFQDLMNAYLDYIPTKIRQHTVDNQAQIIRQHILPAFGKYDVIQCTDPIILGKWRMKMGSLPVKIHRRNYILMVMREILRRGMRVGMIQDAAFAKAEVALEPFSNDTAEVKSERRALTHEEYRKFIDTFAYTDKYQALFRLGFYTGARISELIGLQWEDIDLSGGDLFIKKQAQYLREVKKIMVTPCKTQSSVRHLKLSPEMVGMLTEYKEAYEGKPKDFLFFGKKPSSKNPIVYQIKKHCALAGIDEFSPHEMRHTVASWLVASCSDTSDLILVQKWLGHSSLKETLDTYSHLIKGHGKSVSETISKAVFPAKNT